MKKLVFDLYPYNGGSAFLRGLFGAAKHRDGIPQPLRAGKDLHDRAGHERGRAEGGARMKAEKEFELLGKALETGEPAAIEVFAKALRGELTKSFAKEGISEEMLFGSKSAPIQGQPMEASCIDSVIMASDEEILHYFKEIMLLNRIKRMDMIERMTHAAAAISGNTPEEERAAFHEALQAKGFDYRKALKSYLIVFAMLNRL